MIPIRTPRSHRALLAATLAVFVFTLANARAYASPRDPAEAARVAKATRPTDDFSKPEAYELNPAGAGTSFKAVNLSAFSHPSANMSFERRLDFKIGDGVFRKLWVAAPSSTKSSDGLGPLFNSRSCQGCHLKDGRGHPAGAGGTDVSLFLRLSVPPATVEEKKAIAEHRATAIPEPTYGGQLQNFSIPGVPGEGRMDVSYEEVPVVLGDGIEVSLRKPTYRAVDLAHGPMRPDAMMSPRIASPMIGIGLLEAIPEEDILANADPNDADGDGIRGRANRVWSRARQQTMLGRFGWKAGEATVDDQVAGAFSGDIGISSHLAPEGWGDCMPAQKECRAAPRGGDAEEVEVPRRLFDLVVFYSRNLAVPARRDIDKPTVLAGKKLFYDAGCASCHRPKFVTRRDSIEPEQSFQLIWPYTDLLLHDMGEGLADHRPEGMASGRDWRTPPLWGIGLTEAVGNHTYFLHDGRARDLLEAILWHDGEARPAKRKVMGMTKTEREALIAFLNSL